MAALVRERESGLVLIRREVESKVRSSHRKAAAAATSLAAYERAARLADENYIEQERDARLGVATTLERLQALSSRTEARRALDRARFDWLAAMAVLRSLTGQVGRAP